MEKLNKCRAMLLQDEDNIRFIYGSYHKHLPYTPAPIREEPVPEEDYVHLIITDGFTDWNMSRGLQVSKIKKETLGWYIGKEDKRGQSIYSGDYVELEVDGKKCIFEVQIKEIVREVKSHPDFVEEYARVSIITAVFIWKGYELLPCVDENGKVDTSNMQVIGNTTQNPELAGRDYNEVCD